MSYLPLTSPLTITGPLAVTGTFWQTTQPVSGTVTANISGTVPVSGTFWQATQPVSIASMPTTPVTGTFWQATQPVSGTFFQATQPVSIASMPSTPVTGTFWQATQPVSGTVTANISGTVPVSGTFFQATQPVSLAALPALTAGAAVIGSLVANQTVNLAQINGVTIATGNGVAGGNTQRVAIASDNTAFVTKSEAQNSRVTRNFILDVFTAAPVADAMQSVLQWYGNAAVVATVSPAVVPAGKILRLTGGRIETKSLATIGSVVMRIRVNTAGTAVIGSPIAASASAGSTSGSGTTAVTGGYNSTEFTFGDEGLEIPAAAGVGFSLAGYGPTGTLTLEGVTRFEVWGYEYTA